MAVGVAARGWVQVAAQRPLAGRILLVAVPVVPRVARLLARLIVLGQGPSERRLERRLQREAKHGCQHEVHGLACCATIYVEGLTGISEPTFMFHILDSGRQLRDPYDAHGREYQRREPERANDERDSQRALADIGHDTDAALGCARPCHRTERPL